MLAIETLEIIIVKADLKKIDVKILELNLVLKKNDRNNKENLNFMNAFKGLHHLWSGIFFCVIDS